MTRVPRKKRQSKVVKSAPVPVAPEHVTSVPGVEWPVQQRLVLRCPLCGRTGVASYMSPKGVTIGVENGPYELQMKIQRFGGSMPGSQGWIDYENLEDIPPEWRSTVREKLKAALQLIGGE